MLKAIELLYLLSFLSSFLLNFDKLLSVFNVENSFITQTQTLIKITLLMCTCYELMFMTNSLSKMY